MEVKPGYVCPKGYRQTEVGAIPEDWEVRQLGEIASIKTGPFGSALHERDYVQDGTPIITVEHLDDFGVLHSNLPMVSESDNRRLNAYTLELDDIVFSRVGAIDRNALIRLAEVGWLFSGRLLRVRLNSGNLFAPYLSYHFHDTPFKLRVKSVAVGQTMASLNTQILRGIDIVLPPLPEQRAIAEALSDVDALIGALDSALIKKGDLKSAVIQQLLTGQTRLPGFHGEWEVKRLGEISEIAMGRTPPRLNSAYWGRGYKWLSIADLQTKIVTESNEEITEFAASEMKIIPKGTLLMSFKLSIGRLCFAGCDLFTNEAICSFNKLQANADFLYYVLGRTDFSLYGKQAVKGYTLNKESLKLVAVSLPSLAEQTAIAEVLSDMDAELAALEQRRDKTRALKQGMIQELLTGRTRLV